MRLETELKRLENCEVLNEEIKEASQEKELLIQGVLSMCEVLKEAGAIVSFGCSKIDEKKEFDMSSFNIVLNDEMHWDFTLFEDELEAWKYTHSFVVGLYSMCYNIMIAKKKDDSKKVIVLP